MLPCSTGEMTHCTLPLAAAWRRTRRVDTPLPQAPAGSRGRVLFVDDDRNSGEAVCELLRFVGYDCVWKDGVRTAFAALADRAARTADVLMLDLRLKDGDEGATLVHQLREAGLPVPPIVIFSARTPAFVDRVGREIGAHGVLYKPSGIDAICRALENARAAAPAH